MAKSSFYTRIINISDYIDSSNIESVKKRLFDKSMPEPNTGCVIWCGCIFSGGYGRMWVRDKQIMAHRVSYFIDKGEIPEDFVVDHLCNNPSCINPLHLEAKTQRDNGLRVIGSPTTINALKTHCKRGHEFTVENTYLDKSGKGRSCKACAVEHGKQWYLKNRVLAIPKPRKTKEDFIVWKRNYYKKNRLRILEQQQKRRKNKKNG